jgi:hypothetical protein
MNLIGGTNWHDDQHQRQLAAAGVGTSNTQNNPGLLSNISSGIGLLGALF